MNAQLLEERLIQFAVDVILLTKTTENNYAAQHLANQLIRSSTSAALNYGEARSAESNRDFIHKMRVCLKELRECLINMKTQKGADLVKNIEKLNYLIKENDELISIFVVSIKTSSQKIKNR